MQTFAPYSDLQKIAKCLDYRRLGKQRVETFQILDVLFGKSTGWANHPAVKQWRGYEGFLCQYGLAICDEWISRGYKDTMRPRIAAYAEQCPSQVIAPPWWGLEVYHSSHRQTLLSKNFDWYKQFGWTEQPKYEYYWPAKQ